MIFLMVILLYGVVKAEKMMNLLLKLFAISRRYVVKMIEI